jgi:rfaE bifunctional protein nucleotidyltransferase chain/domain
MKKKVVTINELQRIVNQAKKAKKKIVLVHGVFDVIHLGHIEYFREAKSYGNILIASVTCDQFVNKGFNKPYFKETERCNFLSSIELIDYVVISQSHSSTFIINYVKPNFYCKGPDYKKKNGDQAGNLLNEKKCVEKNGGKLIITNGVQFSSTSILNSSFQNFNLAKDQIKHIFKGPDEKNIFLDKFDLVLKKIKKEKILVIGEIIIDNYIDSSPLGSPSKENILSVHYKEKKSYLGGTVPVVKNISEICENITFVSLFNKKETKDRLKKELSKKVNLKLFYAKDFIEIEKNRFLNKKTKSKIFEFYKFNNKEYLSNSLLSFLKVNLKKFDKVVICDFGHGLFSKKVISVIETSAKFICANVQTNSGNRGFNLFTKFKKVEFICVDEPEFRIGLSERYKSMKELLNNNKQLIKYKNLLITLGIDGLLVKFNNKKKSQLLSFPALNKKVLDTLGAGDAVFSYAAAFINNTKDIRMLAIVGSIAGAIKTNILGHSSFVSINDVKKSLHTILK